VSTVAVASDLVIPSGTTVTFGADDPAYQLQGGATWPETTLTLTDQGTIQVTSSQDNATLSAFGAAGAGYFYYGVINIAPTGVVTVNASGANSTAYGYLSGGNAQAEIENDGTLTVSALYQATGISLGLADISFDNTGSMSVTGATNATGVFDSSSSSTIDNHGSITVSGTNAVGVELVVSGDHFHNYGSLTVTGTTSAYGVTVGDVVLPADITNTGTITAPIAVIVQNGPGRSAPLVLTNSGRINGDIVLGTQPLTNNPGWATGSTITNTGTINGAVHLSGDGTDLYDGRGGTLSNGIYLGGGADTVYLGNDGETVFAGTGTATIFGGTGADTITGGAGNDVINGGGGNDTLTGGGGADTFIFQPGVGTAVVTDFSSAQGDVIDLDNFGTFSSLSDVLAAAAQVNNDTVITLGSGESVTLQNVQLSSLTAADFEFTVSPISVTGLLTIPVGQNLTFNGPHGGLGAYVVSSTGSLEVYGTVLVQDTQASDTLSGVNASGGVIGSPALWIETGGSVTVSATGSGDTAFGFYAAQALDFENDGTFSVSSTGTANGVTMIAGGVFLNTGVMTVAGQDVTTGVSATGLTVAANSGSLSVSGVGRVDGVEIAGSGQFENVGTITVTSSGGATYGVLAGDSAGSLFNITNSGTITAQYAINAIASSGPMSVANSGTLNGDVVFGTAAGNQLTNTGAVHGSVSFNGTSGQQVYNGQGGTLTGAITFASGSGVTGTDYAYLGNDGETVQGGTAVLYAYGGAGADHITAGFGGYIDGGGGNDTLDGGSSGASVVSFLSSATGVTVSLALQGQAQNTGDGIDTITRFAGLVGSKFADHLTGDANNNSIDGGGGNDTIDGGGGINTLLFASATQGVTVSLALQGQAQNTGVGIDTLTNFQNLVGSSYNDTLEGGGSASSSLTGGLGADTFVYQSGDGAVTVTDFSAAQGDKIDVSSISTLTNLSAVLAASSQQGSNTVISLAGGTLTLQGVAMSSLTASDFLFAQPAGNGTINGTSGNDWLEGGSGNDTLHGGGGSDYLNGGGGVNTALYDGAYLQYALTLGSPATVTGGPEGGTDDLVNIQRIQFVDGYLATSPTDTAAEVYRLYEAALGRLPDPVGLAGWTHALNNGESLQAVAASFVSSQEFVNTYGNLDNTHFITLLYQNVLHRLPDPGGMTGWLGYMAQGHSQADVLIGFSQSQEDINDLTAPVQQGLWIQDAAAAEVARLYDAVLGRLPDIGGLTGWTHALENGSVTLLQVAQDFAASAEFQNVYGNLDDTDFVTRLYENALHREPDTAGLAGWVGFLAEGNSRAQVVLDFSESQEHINDTAAHINNGIWLA
jgi:Ca2+-binding RTX toxin-like protein